MSSGICSCLREWQNTCGIQACSPSTAALPDPTSPHTLHLNGEEWGRMMYTCSILLMFSAVIVALMFRSIKRNSSSVENVKMEALLDAMRFREELDMQQRQRRRLLRAKTKVSAWLSKTHGEPGVNKGWQSSPQLIEPPRKHTIRFGSQDEPDQRYCSSLGSEIPEIVITEDGTCGIGRARTPALSLIYDFNNECAPSPASSHRVRGSISSIGSAISGTSFASETRHSVSLDRDDLPLPSLLNVTLYCKKDFRELIKHANNQLWREHKNSKEYLAGADMYTCVILILFASIIIVLLVRSVKPGESLDDQVTILLSSMRVRVEDEENMRHRRKMREAKRAAQRWLADIKQKSVRRLSSTRNRRSNSESEAPSVASVPVRFSQRAKLQSAARTRSYQGYLPEIVVTDSGHVYEERDRLSSCNSRPLSRQSSISCYDENLSVCEVFCEEPPESEREGGGGGGGERSSYTAPPHSEHETMFKY